MGIFESFNLLVFIPNVCFNIYIFISPGMVDFLKTISETFPTISQSLEFVLFCNFRNIFCIYILSRPF